MKQRLSSLKFIKRGFVKVLSYVIVGALCLILGFVFGTQDKQETFITLAEDIVKTVDHSHIDSEDFELIYRDPENDVAYYRYVGVRDLITVGTVLYLYDGREVTVSATGRHGFTVSSNTVTFTVGMSGDPVLNADGEQIGYISALLQNGHVYCIWS